MRPRGFPSRHKWPVSSPPGRRADYHRHICKAIAVLGLSLSLFVAEAGPPSASGTPSPVGPEISTLLTTDGAHGAAESVRRETGGRVLDVRPLQEPPSEAYEVRILLDEGRVRRIRVDSDPEQAR